MSSPLSISLYFDERILTLLTTLSADVEQQLTTLLLDRSHIDLPENVTTALANNAAVVALLLTRTRILCERSLANLEVYQSLLQSSPAQYSYAPLEQPLEAALNSLLSSQASLADVSASTEARPSSTVSTSPRNAFSFLFPRQS